MRPYRALNRRAANYVRAVTFDHPEWTPCSVNFLPATWMQHRERLEEVVLAHPRVFPGFRKGQVDFDQKKLWNPLYELGRHTDCWGTVWNNIARGFDSIVEREPLADWADFEAWKSRLPDPMKDGEFGPRASWESVAAGLETARSRGDLVWGGGIMHGFFFMRMYYLRGFENLMLDYATDDPRVHELAAIVTAYNTAIVRRYLDLGVDVFGLAEDLGMQTALPTSPGMWRRFVKPGYEATAGLCRDRGVPVYLHSDGHILEIVDDLIETGVRILNPQIRANGLEGLRRVAKGRVCLNQDLDRQLFPFATPSEIEDHVGEVFEGLHDPRGGLMLTAECGPEVPLANVDAICRAFERLCRLPEPQA